MAAQGKQCLQLQLVCFQAALVTSSTTELANTHALDSSAQLRQTVPCHAATVAVMTCELRAQVQG